MKMLRHLHGSHKLIAGLLSASVCDYTITHSACARMDKERSVFNEIKVPSRNNMWEFLLLYTALGEYTAFLVKNAPAAWKNCLNPSLNRQLQGLQAAGEIQIVDEIIKRNPVLLAHRSEQAIASDGFAREEIDNSADAAPQECDQAATFCSLQDGCDQGTTSSAKAEGSTSHTSSQTRAKKAPLIEIRLLNQLSIRMNGVLLNPSELRLRRMGEVLGYLGLQGQYCARRFDIINAVWGECDFEYGMRRLYEAASATRRCARDKGVEENILKISKVEGSMFLNPEQVYCDVHDFEKQAHDMLKHNYNDDQIITYGCRALALFGSGAEFCPGDISGSYLRRIREINNLFGDVSLEVCSAALRQGKSRLASQTIEAAFSLLPIREDIVLALLKTLRDSRRVAEIATFISVYRAHLRTLGVRKVPECIERYINEIIEETKRDYHDIPRLGYHEMFNKRSSLYPAVEEDISQEVFATC